MENNLDKEQLKFNLLMVMGMLKGKKKKKRGMVEKKSEK